MAPTHWSLFDCAKVSPGSAGHLTAIADGQMDLALVSTTSPGSQLVALRELMREPMIFVGESSHPLADRRRVELVDLAGHDFIHFPPGRGIRRRLDAGFAAAGVHPVSAYEVADYATLIRHVADGAKARNALPQLRELRLQLIQTSKRLVARLGR